MDQIWFQTNNKICRNKHNPIWLWNLKSFTFVTLPMEGMKAMVLFCKKNNNNNWDPKVILPHVQHQPNLHRTRTKAPALWTSLSRWTLSWPLSPTVPGSKLEGTWETTSHRRSGWNRTVLLLLSTVGKTHSRYKIFTFQAQLVSGLWSLPVSGTTRSVCSQRRPPRSRRSSSVTMVLSLASQG